MNYHYRYRLGPRSRPFISIDSQLPSRKSFEVISVTVTVLKCSWIRKVIISNMTVNCSGASPTKVALKFIGDLLVAIADLRGFGANVAPLIGQWHVEQHAIELSFVSSQIIKYKCISGIKVCYIPSSITKRPRCRKLLPN